MPEQRAYRENKGCGLRCRLSGVPCADVESCLDGGAAPVVLLDAVVVVVPGFGFVLYGCRIRSVFPCVCSIGSGPVEHLELVHVSGWF